MRVLATILVWLVVALAAKAEEHTDATARFRVTVPDGWQKTAAPEKAVALALISPRAEETMGILLIQSDPLPGTDTLTQAELDESLAGQFDKAFWTDALKEAGLKDIVIEGSGEEKQNGRNTYYAIATYAEGDARMKVKFVAHFVPGRGYNLFSSALAEAYPREDADFATIFDSFTPLDSGLVASRAPARPSATLGSTSKNALQTGWLRGKAIESSRVMKALVQGAFQNRKGKAN